MAPPGEHGALSARTVLEVADGLRWADPPLGVALAEHAVRLAGDDETLRAAAQRTVIRSLAEVDRFDEVVSRAAALLDDAVAREDRDGVAGLLVELAAAAIGVGDDALAARLVEPVASAAGLPAPTLVRTALVRAELAGSSGEVGATDRAAEEAGAALRHTTEPETGLVRRDLARARAAARRRSGDLASALSTVSEVVSGDPGADPDGGRRSLLAAADEVELLLDLGRRDEALARGDAALPPDSSGPLVVCPAARVRLALAERVHLAGGDHTEAQELARTSASELEAAGHDAAAARAWEVVAAAAEHAGELEVALAAVRRAHELDSRARDRRDPALRVLTVIAAAVPDLPPPPAERSDAPATGQPPAPGATTLSDIETLLTDASSSVAGADGAVPRPGRRNQPHQDDAEGRSGPETVPEALARPLGTGSVPGESPSEASSDRENGSRPDGQGDLRRAHPEVGSGSPPPASPGGVSRRSRHSAGSHDEASADTTQEPSARAGAPPTFEAFSTASSNGVSDGAAPVATLAGPSGATDADAPPTFSGPPTIRSTGWECGDISEFPHIDPADPLGTGSPGGTLSDRSAAAAADGADDSAPDAARSQDPEQGPATTEPAPRQEVPGTARPASGASSLPAGFDPDDPDGELALTLAGLLAEYHPVDTAGPTPPGTRSADVAVPSARGNVSGPTPLPATDQRSTSRPGDTPEVSPPPSDVGAHGRAGRGENGARLADLLAEAMDAFRHTGPGAGSSGNGDGPHGPDVGSRR